MGQKGNLQRNLRLIRTCVGWTAEELAKRLELSRPTISAIERDGGSLTMVQYLAIRKVLDDEIAQKQDEEDTKMLSIVIDVLVDNPQNYTVEERNEILLKAKLMAPAIMKQPSERKAVSNGWSAILLASGAVVTAGLIALLRDKK